MPQMQETLKRVVFQSRNHVIIEEMDIPKLAPNQVLIRTVSTLISTGTELAHLQGTHIGMKVGSSGILTPPFYPFVPGYSSAGVVVQVGDRVSGFKAGDRVFARGPHASHVLCENQPWLIQKIPDDVSFDQAIFTVVCNCALLAVRTARITVGEPVAVLGLGIVGQLCVQMARIAGARALFGIDMKSYRLETAKANGADFLLNPAETDITQEARRILGSDGLPVVMDATGSAKAFLIALKLAAPFGRVMLVGCPQDSVELSPFPEIFFKCLTIKGCAGQRIPTTEIPQFPWTRQEMHGTILRFVRKGVLHPEKLITHRVPYGEAPGVYEMLMAPPDDLLGVILDWSAL